jgi:hypothetical protein
LGRRSGATVLAGQHRAVSLPKLTANPSALQTPNEHVHEINGRPHRNIGDLLCGVCRTRYIGR